MPERIWNLLTSTRLALALFGILSVLSLVGTLPGMDAVYRNPGFRVILGLLGACTLACTVRKRKIAPWPVLVIHAGVIMTLVGGMMSWLGFIATVNVYEADQVDSFFRWDIEQDAPLGFALAIDRINTEYYPVPIRIGVMEGNEKRDLYTLRTGESFDLGGYRIRADRLQADGEKAFLTVFRDKVSIGTADTEGASALPPDFPFSFKLVAYQNPKLKRMWVDLRLTNNGKTLVQGVSEVNAPLQWNGLSFYHTRTSRDPDGRRYAGIQIVKDPGKPLVFAGMIVTTLGGLLSFARRKVWK